jgi:hypothetical protein
MSLTFGRSNRANLYPICRGIWYFAVKAHQSVFRVESRLAQSVAYTSVYAALRAMAERTLADLKEAFHPDSGQSVSVVSDNVQEFQKQQDHRIGRQNKMIKGLAGTVVEMEGVTPEAFDLKELVQRQALLERRQLNTEMIIQDTDWDHLERAATVEILHTLIQFIPVLSIYQQALLDFSTTSLQKNPIPTCRSKIFPLATNSCDEMHVQEMKQGVLDFITTQLGISKENVVLLSRGC